MEQEIEFKYDLPTNIDPDSLLADLRIILEAKGWNIELYDFVALRFTYFDTPTLDIHKKGETIREVSRFPIERERYKARFRYDFKIGPIDNRFEHSEWTNEQLSISEFMPMLPTINYKDLSVSAAADTEHRLLVAEKDGTELEVTIDHFSPDNGPVFTELEIEFEHGSEESFRDLCSRVQEKYAFKELHTQKYSRIIESI